MTTPASVSYTNRIDEGDDFFHATINIGDHSQALIVYGETTDELAERVQIIVAAFNRAAQIEDRKQTEAEEFAKLF